MLPVTGKCVTQCIVLWFICIIFMFCYSLVKVPIQKKCIQNIPLHRTGMHNLVLAAFYEQPLSYNVCL